LNLYLYGKWFNAGPGGHQLRLHAQESNSNGIADSAGLFTFERVLYISVVSSGGAISGRGENRMAARKSSKNLKKGKKIQPTLPLLKRG
jgi:hypothetical protein